ncbi:hypothetical protein GH733_003930 [Mirounga leonina]|nr:hypothetical protein GH733_003930 [Mirounga leonina]
MGSGTPGQAVAGGRLPLGPGPPRAGRHRKMAAASARLRPAKWRERRVPGWSGAGRARGACARRWAGPRCVARAAAPGLPLASREGGAVPASSEVPEPGSERRGPPRVLACVCGATWRGFSQPVKSRPKLASPHTSGCTLGVRLLLTEGEPRWRPTPSLGWVSSLADAGGSHGRGSPEERCGAGVRPQRAQPGVGLRTE